MMIILNFYIIASISPLNKEILTYLSFLYLLLFKIRKNLFFMILSIIFAFFCRGNFLFIILTYFTLELLIINQILKKNTVRGIYIILILSILSYITFNYDEISLSAVNDSWQGPGSLGITKIIDEFNSKYYIHFITIFIKIVGNLFGGIIKPLNNTNLEHLFNFLSQIYFLIIILILFFKKKDYLKTNEFLFLLIYCMIFSSHSFIHHRYLLPSSIIFIYFIFSKKIFIVRL